MSAGTRRRPVLRVVAVIAIVAGIIGGIRLWAAADQRLDDAVAGMARAPVGCDTILDFDTEGTYLLFVETQGELDDVRGDCDVDPAIEWSGDELPSVTLTLVGPDDEEIELDEETGVDYDTGASTGTSVESVDIEVPGDHVLRVQSADSGFAIAVGRDPNGGVVLMRLMAVAVVLLGIVVGAVIVLRTRRRGHEASTDESPWMPQPGGQPQWPMSPPGFPAPPPTTGTTAVVGRPTGPTIRPSSGPLPTPPADVESDEPTTAVPSRPSVAPIPGQPGPWSPPPPPAGKRPGT